MIKSIVDHFQKMLPVWIVGIIMSGIGVAITGAVAWHDLQRDLALIKCKLGVEENNQCRWTSTIVEDIEAIDKYPEEDSE